MLKRIKGRIVDFPNKDKIREIPSGEIVYDDETGIIQEVNSVKDEENSNLIVPGFFDLHTHFPQYLIRGIYKGDLLDWLEKVVFQEEEKFSQSDYALRVANAFFYELVRNGITTACVYSTIHKEATEIAFGVASKLGIRILMGKMIMTDKNQGDKEIEDSLELFERWNNFDERIFYAFSPRYPLSVDFETLTKIGNLAKELDSYVQTHFAENVREIEMIRKKWGLDYLEIYVKSNLLGPKTLLGHSIHVTDGDLDTIKKTNTRVVHNPQANLFLNSGRFPVEKYDSWQIDFGLGSDIGAGYSLSPFETMKAMYFLNPVPVPRLYYHLTLGSAKMLGWEEKLGSFDFGKELDCVVINYPNNTPSREDIVQILSKCIFLGCDIKKVIVRGKTVFKATMQS